MASYENSNLKITTSTYGDGGEVTVSSLSAFVESGSTLSASVQFGTENCVCFINFYPRPYWSSFTIKFKIKKGTFGTIFRLNVSGQVIEKINGQWQVSAYTVKRCQILSVSESSDGTVTMKISPMTIADSFYFSVEDVYSPGRPPYVAPTKFYLYQFSAEYLQPSHLHYTSLNGKVYQLADRKSGTSPLAYTAGNGDIRYVAQGYDNSVNLSNIAMTAANGSVIRFLKKP